MEEALRHRIAELEAENRRLQQQLAYARSTLPRHLFYDRDLGTTAADGTTEAKGSPARRPVKARPQSSPAKRATAADAFAPTANRQAQPSTDESKIADVGETCDNW
jgi:hypothetical protein